MKLLLDGQFLQTNFVWADWVVSIAHLAGSRDLVLRHQLNILRRSSSKKPTLSNVDRLIFAGVVSLEPWYSWRSDNHQAGYADPLAPRWVSTVLAVEIETSRWPAKSKTGSSAAHSRDEYREPILGSTADPWRTPQAWH